MERLEAMASLVGYVAFPSLAGLSAFWLWVYVVRYRRSPGAPGRRNELMHACVMLTRMIVFVWAAATTSPFVTLPLPVFRLTIRLGFFAVMVAWLVYTVLVIEVHAHGDGPENRG